MSYKTLITLLIEWARYSLSKMFDEFSQSFLFPSTTRAANDDL